MISRSDASSSAPSTFSHEGDRDLFAINGHHFELDGTGDPLGGAPA